ncbi:MAG: lysylphosphatidylglycerol synthase transmembrane domain-containing protein [Verrucomicrobia bacterium]|nr:lysylphosphatidylglycerol synthase transmembrane domain-containing protein [Verrucomicrobiota bacterium]
MTARTRITWLLRWLVSAGLLAWILTRPEVGRLGPEWQRLNLVWLLAGLLCAGLSLALGAWRWQACLQALGLDLPLGRLFKVTLAAAAAGGVSFGALGTDLARVLLAGSQWPGRRGRILSSLALDHASALPWVVLMVLAAVLAHGTMPVMLTAGVWLVLGVVGAVAVATAVVSWRFRRFHLEIMQVLADRATWGGFMLAMWRSVPVWLAYCGIYYCAARAFGVVVPMAGFAGVIAIADGVASLPVTIAGLGVREQAFQTLLGNWYGVPPPAAVALSLTGFSLTLGWAALGALCIGGRPLNPEPTVIP